VVAAELLWKKGPVSAASMTGATLKSLTPGTPVLGMNCGIGV